MTAGGNFSSEKMSGWVLYGWVNFPERDNFSQGKSFFCPEKGLFFTGEFSDYVCFGVVRQKYFFSGGVNFSRGNVRLGMSGENLFVIGAAIPMQDYSI